jgi:sugar phosphate permease
MVNADDAPASWRARIFAASWLSYFSYYFTRMPLKAAKTSVQDQYHLSTSQLNYIDTAYSAAYCLGQVGSGFLADWIGPRWLVAGGMLLSAAMAFAFQAADSLTGSVLGVLVLLWGINGLAQATGWPGNSKLMAAWFSSRQRGEVLGWWSTCYQAGGLVAALFAARLLGAHGWRAAFIGPAIWVAVVAVGFAAVVRSRPSDLGLRDATGQSSDAAERRRQVRAAWPEVLRTPMVWAMGGAYFSCKMIRYSFLFWLPYYLERSLGYDKVKSVEVSIAFDGGGIVLVVLAGILADRVFARARVATAFGFLVALVGALFLYRHVGARTPTSNVLCLALVGGCLFAADSLISGAVAQDLGGPHAAALASGLINGIGSVGQVIQGFVLVFVLELYGWATAFEMFGVLAGVAALLCLPFLRVRGGRHEI